MTTSTRVPPSGTNSTRSNTAASCAGRIAKLFVGNGHGFIRLADKREVYFHRADIAEGLSIHDFAVGDSVAFELFEDAVSGARCLRVTRRSTRS